MNNSDIERTLRVLWRTIGFLSGLAHDIKSLSPDRAETCREFVDWLESEARRLQEVIAKVKEKKPKS